MSCNLVLIQHVLHPAVPEFFQSFQLSSPIWLKRYLLAVSLAGYFVLVLLVNHAFISSCVRSPEKVDHLVNASVIKPLFMGLRLGLDCDQSNLNVSI